MDHSGLLNVLLMSFFFGIHLTAIVVALALTKLFAANRLQVRLLIGSGVSLLVAALEAYRAVAVFGLSKNLLETIGAFLAAIIPVMAALGVYSPAERFSLVWSILAGAMAIPFALVVLIIAGMAGDWL